MNGTLQTEITRSLEIKADPLYQEIKKFQKGSGFQNYSNRESGVLFKRIRKEFFNDKNYTWSLKSCTAFVNRCHINPNIFKSFLESFFDHYFHSENAKGSKSAFQLIDRLSQSKMFNSSSFRFEKLELKKDANIISFLEDMKRLNKHLNFSHNNMVKFIEKSFNTGLSEATLRRYYFDQQK